MISALKMEKGSFFFLCYDWEKKKKSITGRASSCSLTAIYIIYISLLLGILRKGQENQYKERNIIKILH